MVPDSKLNLSAMKVRSSGCHHSKFELLGPYTVMRIFVESYPCCFHFLPFLGFHTSINEGCTSNQKSIRVWPQASEGAPVKMEVEVEFSWNLNWPYLKF